MRLIEIRNASNFNSHALVRPMEQQFTVSNFDVGVWAASLVVCTTVADCRRPCAAAQI